MGDMTGQVALVTGGIHRIGQAIPSVDGGRCTTRHPRGAVVSTRAVSPIAPHRELP